MIGDTSNYLALAVKPVDVATPLLQAAKIRQSQMEAQQTDIAMKKDAAGQFARGVMTFADKPEFAQKWAEGLDQLHAAGMIDPQSYGRMRENPSPLMARSIIAQTESPQIAFGREQLAETVRSHKASEDQAEETLKETRRGHDITEAAPIIVPPGSTAISKKTGQPLFANKGGAFDSETLDAMADQYLTGDKSVLTNIGKGAQGAENIASLRQRITERGKIHGMGPAEIAAKLQDFQAEGIGKSAEARTSATREANLNLILKATEAAIPAALAASDDVVRYAGSFVPLNKIIQGGEVMTSDANLRKFGMANLQLAEHWARAMNPTGVMRESDRDLALKFLSTADSKDTYKQVVGQLKTQITRERDAVRSTRGGGATAPAPGAAPTAPTPQPGAAQGSGGAPAPPAGFQLVK